MTASLFRKHPLVKLLCISLLCATMLTSPSGAQVTFSRDWNAGKRSLAEATSPMYTRDCSAIWRSVNNLCATITKDIQHLALCETRSMLKSYQPDDVSMENSSGNNLPLFSNNNNNNNHL